MEQRGLATYNSVRQLTLNVFSSPTEKKMNIYYTIKLLITF